MLISQPALVDQAATTPTSRSLLRVTLCTLEHPRPASQESSERLCISEFWCDFPQGNTEATVFAA